MADFISRFGLTTIIWSAVMIAWFITDLRTFHSSVKEDPFGEYELPHTMSVLGVLGTFIGIAIGLYGFDPSPTGMQTSVTNLLSGMKTAFITSIIGMGFSLGLKNYQAKVQKNFSKNNFVKPESTIADLIQYLQRADAEKSAQIEHLEKILQTNNENVIRALDDFGKTLSENNAKIFIDALNETMKEFNKKLTEQFGENFKQLNVAVGRLLVWQENYKVTIERITENLQKTIKGIDAVKNSVASRRDYGKQRTNFKSYRHRQHVRAKAPPSFE